MELKAVIFDLDGVIVSTDECHYKAWKQMADKEGIYFDTQINIRLRGVSRMESLEIILEKSSKIYSSLEKEGLATQKNQYYQGLIQQLTPRDILPGVSNILSELKEKNVKVAIGSSSRNAPLILERVCLDTYFDVVVEGNQISNSKPDPEVFLLAAKKLNISPEDCLVIEDADAGVDAAIAAGMKVLGIGTATSNKSATFTADDLTGISIIKMIDIPVYKNQELSFEERARDLVSGMTLEEKVTQMVHNAPAIPRLGIMEYNWWNESLHGVARAGVATIFPQTIGMAATFDEALIYCVADVISTEGRAKFNEFQRKNNHGIYKGLTFWSPNINIFRDPRWGRGHETYGEDPYLTGRLGVAYVKGIQGNDSKYLKAAACVKHFAVHSGPEDERHSFNAEVPQKDLRETYLPAFKECIKEAKVEAVMGAYNRTNGEPCCGSKTLLKKILREEWEFKGHVTSDCWAIKDFHMHHMVTNTAPESVALAVNSGCDMNCGNMYANLLIAHQEGLISEETIDLSVTRLMMARMKLGMFDDPKIVPFTSIPYEMNDCREHRELSLEVSKKSMVLLKNENNFLPLNKRRVKSIAVIGPNANSRDALVGNYIGTASRYITVLEGIQDAVDEDTRIYYAQGCHLYKNKVEGLAEIKDRFAEAVSAAERADVVVLCLGLDASIEGEEGDASNEYASGDKKTLNLPGLQQELMETIVAIGKPVISVLLSGSALAVTWAHENVSSIIQAWYPGAEGGKAVASLLFGDYSPSGRLPVTFYRSNADLPDFKDYSMKNRTYRYMQTEALYPFGYGLSYSKFEYSNLRFEKKVITTSESMGCSVKVKNIGTMDAEETVQLYLKDIEASVEVPKWELQGITKLYLKTNEEKEVNFKLTPRQMALIDYEGECILEPGRFEVYIGGSQPDQTSQFLAGTRVINGEFQVVGEPVKLTY